MSAATGWRWLQLGRKAAGLDDDLADLPMMAIDWSPVRHDATDRFERQPVVIVSQAAARSGQFREFCEAITHARALDESQRVDSISTAATGGQVVYRRTVETKRPDGTTAVTTVVRYTPPDWRAHAWVLER